jgi:hypothetical protein
MMRSLPPLAGERLVRFIEAIVERLVDHCLLWLLTAQLRHVASRWRSGAEELDQAAAFARTVQGGRAVNSRSPLPSIKVQIERIVEHACERLTYEEARRLSRIANFRTNNNSDDLEAWETPRSACTSTRTAGCATTLQPAKNQEEVEHV